MKRRNSGRGRSPKRGPATGSGPDDVSAMTDPRQAEPENAVDPETDPSDADDRGRWRPKVVDEGVVEFQSTPPNTGPFIGPYMPDTICDGWSTAHMTVRAASVRGYLHRYNQMPRQDDVKLAFGQGSGAIVYAVADGVSGASHPHSGASLASGTAVKVILQELGPRGVSDFDWLTVAQAVAEALNQRAELILGRESFSQDEAEKCIATTLIAGYLLPSDHGISGSIMQIGDSGAWLHRSDGSYEPLLNVKASDYLISSEVSPLPRVPAVISEVDVSLGPESVLLVGTDGFGDPLGDGEGLVGQLFSRCLKAPPPLLEFAHTLDFSRETFDDDRTLVAIWPRPPGAGLGDG